MTEQWTEEQALDFITPLMPPHWRDPPQTWWQKLYTSIRNLFTQENHK